VAQLAGDLSLAEDCAQEACAAAVEQWPREGMPANPGGWVVTVARRRATVTTCAARAPVQGRSAKPCRSGSLPIRTTAPSPATTS